MNDFNNLLKNYKFDLKFNFISEKMKMMNDFNNLHNQLFENLKNDYDFKLNGNYINGTCPVCNHKNSAWAKADNYWYIYCNRLNNCGAVSQLKELYKSQFDNLTNPDFIIKKNPPSKTDPHATARAYLLARGFNNQTIENNFQQGSYFNNKINQGSPTARFYLNNNLYYDRLIKPLPETPKGHYPYNIPRKGLFFKPIQVQINQGDDVYLTEGVFDALSLVQVGLNAVACMGVNLPLKDILKYKHVNWIVALDNDKAGKNATFKFVKLLKALNNIDFRNNLKHNDQATYNYLISFLDELGLDENFTHPCSTTAVFLDDKLKAKDFNDLLLENKLNRADFKKYNENFLIASAKSPLEKAKLLHKRNQLDYFLFDYDYSTYAFCLDQNQLDKDLKSWKKSDGKRLLEIMDADLANIKDTTYTQNKWASFNLDWFFNFSFIKLNDELLKKYAKDINDFYMQTLEDNISIKKIVNCKIKILSYETDNYTGEHWYFVQLKNKLETTTAVFNKFDPQTIEHKLLLDLKGTIWEGSPKDLKYIVKSQTKNLPSVIAQPHLGYNLEHKTYVFKDFGIKNGKIIPVNDMQAVPIEKLTFLKSTFNERLDIQTTNKNYYSNWSKDVIALFGLDGLAILTWWFASLFFNQVQNYHGFFPFMEVWGEPGSGKSTLIRIFWKLLGFNNKEGRDPNKMTAPALHRFYQQLSNMPIVFTESDRSDDDKFKSKKFDWNETKEMYNGGGIRATGVKNTGIEIKAPRLLSSLMAVQNASVDSDPAVMERFISVELNKGVRDENSRLLAARLAQKDVTELSYFLIQALAVEPEVIKMLEENRVKLTANNFLRENKNIINDRVAETHALLYCFAPILAKVLDFSDGLLVMLQHHIIKLCERRHMRIKQDSPLLQSFWDVFDYLVHYKSIQLNHSRDDDLIAINLNEIYEVASSFRQDLPDKKTLQEQIKRGSNRPYLEQKIITSSFKRDDFGGAKKVHCWIFKRK